MMKNAQTLLCGIFSLWRTEVHTFLCENLAFTFLNAGLVVNKVGTGGILLLITPCILGSSDGSSTVCLMLMQSQSPAYPSKFPAEEFGRSQTPACRSHSWHRMLLPDRKSVNTVISAALLNLNVVFIALIKQMLSGQLFVQEIFWYFFNVHTY